jgi:predicted phosphodiesterase
MRALLSVAPVMAVRGNSDKGHWTKGLHDTETFEVCGMLFHLLHDLSALDLDPRAAGIHAVISGHSHRPVISEKDGVLYVNPGSAGPRRFTLPVTLARIRIGTADFLNHSSAMGCGGDRQGDGKEVAVGIVDLQIAGTG